MKKALIIATIENFLAFEVNDIHLLQGLGYEVHIATNIKEATYTVLIDGVYKHDICFQRKPFSKKNIEAYKKLATLVKKISFDLIHCHTPVGGVMGRVVGHKYKVFTIYTAHGFHFYKGAPIKNWLLYYPIEKFLSRWTDILITINKEDYERAKKFYAKKVKYIPGVGIDIEKIENIKVERNKKRKELGIPEDVLVLLSVGELSKRKNHISVIRAMGQIKNKKIYYIICGQGELKEQLENIAKKEGVAEQVKLLGYRRDIIEIYKMADIYVFPSLQEGLPVALMEAMASGLPCIVSDIRGNNDLISNQENGIAFSKKDNEELVNAIKLLAYNNELLQKFSKRGKEIVQNNSIEKIKEKMQKLYSEYKM